VGKIDNKYTADVVVLVRADSTGKMQWNRTCDFLLNAARARFLESNIRRQFRNNNRCTRRGTFRFF
jgi:hypothetical protein